MPDKEWEIALADGIFLLVSRLTVNGRVKKFRVVLLSEKEGVLRCLTRYDTAHGYPHQDILDKDENTIAKIIIPTDSLDTAFHHAINDLKTNAHRYLETFGQD
jgi:hypothetical protein